MATGFTGLELGPQTGPNMSPRQRPSTKSILLICTICYLLPTVTVPVKCLFNASQDIPSVDLKFTSIFPPLITAHKGETILLNCSGAFTFKPIKDTSKLLRPTLPPKSSNNTVIISWRFEGQDITEEDSPRRTILSNGSLVIKKFVPSKRSRKSLYLQYSRALNGHHLLPPSSQDRYLGSPSGSPKKFDEGRYFCIISSLVRGGGSLISSPIDVIAPNFPVLKVDPQETSVREGTNARFSCQTVLTPTTNRVVVFNYSWLLNDKPVDPESRQIKSFGRVIHLLNVSAAEQGNYSCRAQVSYFDKNHDDSPENIHSKPAKFIVEAEDRDQQEEMQFLGPKQVLIKAQENALLECITKNQLDPLTTTRQWTRISGKHLSKSSRVDSHGNLWIGNVTVEDEDVYVCHVNTSALYPESNLMENNLANSSLSVLLSIIRPPVITQLPQDSIHPSAETARLQCQVSGSPTPTISWFKNAKLVNPTGRVTIRENELVISQTTLSDSGFYQCMAENEEGVVTASARLTFMSSAEDMPKAPTGLKVTNVTNSSISLSWTKPVSKNPVMIYTVHVTPQESNEIQVISTNTSTTIDGLQPFTNYTIYVRGYNFKTAGEVSQEITVETLEAVPVSGPHFTLRALSSTKLLFSWKPLSKQLARGIVTTYEIQYKPVTQENFMVTQFSEVSVSRFILDNLRPGVTYEFRMLAATSRGYPNVSSSDLFPWTLFTMPTTDIGMTVAPELMTSSGDHTIESEFLEEDESNLDEHHHYHQQSLPSSSRFTSLSLWFFGLFITFTVIGVLFILISIFLNSLRQVRSPCVDGHGPVPSLLSDSVPRRRRNSYEDREMESFLDNNQLNTNSNGVSTNPNQS